MVQFRKIILTLIGIMCFSLTVAQDYRQAPQTNERVIGTVTASFTKNGKVGYGNQPGAYTSENEVYSILLEKAKKDYPKKVIDLRNVLFSATSDQYPRDQRPSIQNGGYYIYTYSCSAKIVEFISPGAQLNETLAKALDRALSKVRIGSRLAIDQIMVSGELSRETVNDQLIDILLNKNFRVVAKEYLEDLKKELKQQQGGGFNEDTTAETDNFSGVGYFLNVRVNEQSITIRVINVSTGEYEGNATEDF